MNEHFAHCAMWMQGFLQNQIVIRSTVVPDRDALQVNLFSLDETGKLLCFTYSSENYPSPAAFATTPIQGRVLASQLDNVVNDWQRLKLDFWASDSQAEACELAVFSIAPINAYSLDMLFAYHRLLACLETHPSLAGTTIADIITVHKRLKGFLDQQSKKISQALENLSTLAKK